MEGKLNKLWSLLTWQFWDVFDGIKGQQKKIQNLLLTSWKSADRWTLWIPLSALPCSSATWHWPTCCSWHSACQWPPSRTSPTRGPSPIPSATWRSASSMQLAMFPSGHWFCLRTTVLWWVFGKALVPLFPHILLALFLLNLQIFQSITSSVAGRSLRRSRAVFGICVAVWTCVLALNQFQMRHVGVLRFEYNVGPCTNLTKNPTLQNCVRGIGCIKGAKHVGTPQSDTNFHKSIVLHLCTKLKHAQRTTKKSHRQTIATL